MREDLAVAAIASVMTAAGTGNPVVESPPQAIDPQLLVALEEAGVERFAMIGSPITVGVF